MVPLWFFRHCAMFWEVFQFANNPLFSLDISVLKMPFHSRRVFFGTMRYLRVIKKQAGTGPSRRHIQGSKIAKGHQSFKVFSSTALKKFF